MLRLLLQVPAGFHSVAENRAALLHQFVHAFAAFAGNEFIHAFHALGDGSDAHQRDALERAFFFAHGKTPPFDVLLHIIGRLRRKNKRDLSRYSCPAFFMNSRYRLYSTAQTGTLSSIPHTPNASPPIVTAISTRIPGSPTDFPTTFG